MVNVRHGRVVPRCMTTALDVVMENDDGRWHTRGAELALDDVHARRWPRDTQEVVAAMRALYAPDLPTGDDAERRAYVALTYAFQGYNAMQRRVGGEDDLAGEVYLQPVAEVLVTERELSRVLGERRVAVLLANRRRVHATVASYDGDVLLVCERAPLLSVLSRAPKCPEAPLESAHTSSVGRVVMRLAPLLGTGVIVSATPIRSELIDPAADERLLVEFTRVTGRHVRRVRAAVGSHVTVSTTEATCTLRRPAALAVLRRMPDADASVSAGTNGDVERFAGVLAALASHGAIVTMSF